MMRYQIEMTEAQLNLIRKSLEMYFRLLMGQSDDFCDKVAFLKCDMSPENPNHKWIFDAAILTRDHLSEIMRAFFKVAYGVYGTPGQKTDEMIDMIDMWDQIRHAQGISQWGTYLHNGREPIMTIKKVEADG